MSYQVNATAKANVSITDAEFQGTRFESANRNLSVAAEEAGKAASLAALAAKDAADAIGHGIVGAGELAFEGAKKLFGSARDSVTSLAAGIAPNVQPYKAMGGKALEQERAARAA